eukprot:6204195-Pleurochrysis_carterae.AAC.5
MSQKHKGKSSFSFTAATCHAHDVHTTLTIYSFLFERHSLTPTAGIVRPVPMNEWHKIEILSADLLYGVVCRQLSIRKMLAVNDLNAVRTPVRVLRSP